MRWLAFILVFVVLFSFGVSAEASFSCTDGTDITLDEEPYLKMKGVQENKQTYEDCTLVVGDETDIGLVKINTVKGSDAIEIETIAGSSGILGGYELTFTQGSDVTFGDDGVVVEMVNGEIVILDGFDIIAEKKSILSFEKRIINDDQDEILSINLGEGITAFIQDRHDLIVNDYYFNFVGDARIDTKELWYTFYYNSDQDLLVTINPSTLCSEESVLPYFLRFGAIDENNKAETFFNLASKDEEKSCNLELFLQNERGALNTDFAIKSNIDGEEFVFSLPVGEEEIDYYFLLSKEDLLTIYDNSNSDPYYQDYSGLISLADTEDTEPNPIVVCSEQLYTYEVENKKYLTDKSSFNFYFLPNFEDSESATSSCKVTNIDYTGSPYVAKDITLLCPGDAECKFEIDPLFALDALQNFYFFSFDPDNPDKLGIWSCGGKNCLGQANVKLYPFGDRYFPFIPYKSPNNEFEYYDIDDQLLKSSKYYMGEPKQVLVIPTTGESTFTEKSFSTGSSYSLVTIDGGKIRNKARTRTIELVDGGVYELYYHKKLGLVGINCCPGENYVGNSWEDFQIGLDTMDSLKTLGCVSTKSKKTFNPNDENSLRYLKFQSPGSVEECEVKKVTEEETEETDDGEETGEGDEGDVEDAVNPCGDKGGWSCQCGKRSALDSDFSCVESSTSGGLWSSTECTNEENCEINSCQGGDDANFYCCDDNTAAKRPEADRDSSRFAFDENLECKEGTGGGSGNCCDTIDENAEYYYYLNYQSGVTYYYISKSEDFGVEYLDGFYTGSYLIEMECSRRVSFDTFYCGADGKAKFEASFGDVDEEEKVEEECNDQNRNNYRCKYDYLRDTSSNTLLEYCGMAGEWEDQTRVTCEYSCLAGAVGTKNDLCDLEEEPEEETTIDFELTSLSVDGNEDEVIVVKGEEESLDISYTWTSLNPQSSSSFYPVSIYLKTNKIDEGQINAKDSRGTETSTLPKYLIDDLSVGLHLLSVSINHDNEYPETNYGNNIQTVKITVVEEENVPEGEECTDEKVVRCDPLNSRGFQFCDPDTDVWTEWNPGATNTRILCDDGQICDETSTRWEYLNGYIDVKEDMCVDAGTGSQIVDSLIVTTVLSGKYQDAELRFPISYTDGVITKGSFCKIASYQNEEKFNSLDSEVQQDLLSGFNVGSKEELYDMDYIHYSGPCSVKVLATEPSTNPEIKFSCSSSTSYPCSEGLSCQEYKRTGGGITFNVFNGFSEESVEKDYPDLIAWGFDPYVYTCQ